MTTDALRALPGKLWRILKFPFELRKRLFSLEAGSAQLRQDLAQLQQHASQLTSDYAQLRHSLAQFQQDLSHLSGDYAQLRRDHDANIAWLQASHPEIVSAIGKKIEPEQFDQLAQDVFAALHREVGALRDRFGALEQAAAPSRQSLVAAAPEDSRSVGFYLELERRFRGTADEISARAHPYLELLQVNPDAFTPVLDIGSGRGEWLSLLAQHHLPAQGVDLNPINADFCRARGLDVKSGDALAHMARLPADSLGAVTAFHLVEHIPFTTLLALTDEIRRVLKPGGMLIYETPNPENLLVATQSFWLDPTHVRPIPPDLLQFLVLQRGFVDAEIRRLHAAEATASNDPTLQALLSGPRDYAVVACKPA